MTYNKRKIWVFGGSLGVKFPFCLVQLEVGRVVGRFTRRDAYELQDLKPV